MQGCVTLVSGPGTCFDSKAVMLLTGRVGADVLYSKQNQHFLVISTVSLFPPLDKELWSLLVYHCGGVVWCTVPEVV